MNTPDQYESALIIDEFTVLSIPNFVNIPETARSNKIATCIAIQDISQLISRYGKEDASSIISNMGSQFLFRTTNPETLDHFDRLLGKREVKQTSKTRTDFTLKTLNNTGLKEKSILTRERVIKFKPDQVIGIIAEGNKALIEGDCINGNHYMKRSFKSKKDSLFNNEASDEIEIYNRVYLEIRSLLKPPSITPLKFNI